MVIRETTVFTRRVQRILRDEEYRLLQLELIANPEAGDLIPGGGGLRKLRWAGRGKGKRGGTRVVYYWASRDDTLLLLMIYAKNEQDDLSSEQLRLLGRIVREEYS